MPRAARSPHPKLRSSLTRRYAGFTDAVEPSGGFVLPASLSVPLVIKLEDSALRPPQFVTGVHGSYSVVDGACAPSYLEVWLAPLGAYAALGVPMDRLSGHFVELHDVLGADGERLGNLVREAPSWQQRFDEIDRFLLRKIAHGPTVAPEVRFAWQRLVASGGAASIRDIAAGAGWSHKHLITRFRDQVGVTPKRAARLVRFDRLLRRVRGERQPDWPQVAAEHGYVDQAHLIHEFREFVGASPAAFFSSRPANARG